MNSHKGIQNPHARCNFIPDAIGDVIEKTATASGTQNRTTPQNNLRVPDMSNPPGLESRVENPSPRSVTTWGANFKNIRWGVVVFPAIPKVQ